MKWTFFNDHIIASLFALSALIALALAMIFGPNAHKIASLQPIDDAPKKERTITANADNDSTYYYY